MGKKYLKLQNTTILVFEKEKAYYKILDNELLPFCLRDNLENITTKKEYTIEKAEKNREALSKFISNRALSVNRENAKLILNELGISQKESYDEKMKIMECCKGLSISDDYWLTSDQNEKWENVNLRENRLSEVLQQIALDGKPLTIDNPDSLTTGELTAQGAYAKAWFREKNKLYMYKAGANNGTGTEAQREAQTSRILNCFNIPQVEYSLANKGDKIVTKCEQMNSPEYSVTDAEDVIDWCARTNNDIFEIIENLGQDQFYKMIIADYLCSNSDRHYGNWGFYMSNSTGKLLCLHPLFDHNNCFGSFMDSPNGGRCEPIASMTQKAAAVEAVKNCDFRCIKPVTRNMFLNEKMYNSFMSRAVELGLYKEQKLSIVDKITGNKERFVPVEIKADNRNEYWKNLEQKLVQEKNHDLAKRRKHPTMKEKKELNENKQQDAVKKSAANCTQKLWP